ncbi:MAG TPA: class I SAM-dependent methyltransferase [Burkholderiales bacterium]|nr:class I SAM-dependent methyltransferase [Burkholderiales bacterium]
MNGIALRAPLSLSPGRKTQDPYTMLEARFTPRTVFMEIGSPDQTLALRAASYVERVYSIDVSGQLAPSRRAPCNLRLVGCDGVRIPVPEGSVDIAWGGDFPDRLQPEAAAEHLQSVHRGLAHGGEYLFTTQQPVAEVRKRLFAAGFSVVRVALLSLVLKPVRITAIK